jgi:hypothetical protein
VAGLLALGAVLRLRQYASGRSLWVDEALLAWNLVERPVRDLGLPLDDFQAAPLGFLLLARAAIALLGPDEYGLRLVPLLSGLLSLPLFWAVARRVASRPAAALAVGLFAISHPLVYYAAECKQYSTDVLATLLVGLLALRLDEEGRPGRRVALAGAGAFAVVASYAGVLAVGATAAVMVGVRIARGRWRSLAEVGPVLLAWLAAGAAHWVLHLRHVEPNPYWLEFWRGAFMPLAPSSLADLAWFPTAALEIFSEPGGFRLPGLALVAALAGSAAIGRRGLPALYLIAPIALALVASGFQRYPFSGRLLLFAVPALLLLVAEGAIVALASHLPAGRSLGVAFAAVLCAHPAVCAGYHLVRPVSREELRPVISYVAGRLEPGDLVYVYYGARWAFRFYAPRHAFRRDQVIEGTASRADWRGYLRQLDAFHGRARVWLLFSHVHTKSGVDEEAFFLQALAARGHQLESAHAPGAAAYLYDLRGESDPAVFRPRGLAAHPATPTCCPEGAPLDACRGTAAPPSPLRWMSG